MEFDQLPTTSIPYTSSDAINNLIKTVGADTNTISDGYHTFGELYKHRILLWIALALSISVSHSHSFKNNVWRSKKHSDDSELDGWFLLGIGREPGTQMTYHLPISYWDETDFAITLDKAPIFDGHTSEDVLERIKIL